MSLLQELLRSFGSRPARNPRRPSDSYLAHRGIERFTYTPCSCTHYTFMTFLNPATWECSRLKSCSEGRTNRWRLCKILAKGKPNLWSHFSSHTTFFKSAGHMLRPRSTWPMKQCSTCALD
ncbi:hypothetical protein KC19_VG051000 [Ceratodon purpureus]|uniref:Uncharacterized protein n=1 Tax=Ceratodon purpureus TaxID=3225 RepID=A0A8T0HM32_CERPU|nr:hypothetical protein KC19_VG051000 [Ceratodon purpureus]